MKRTSHPLNSPSPYLSLTNPSTHLPSHQHSLTSTPTLFPSLPPPSLPLNFRSRIIRSLNAFNLFNIFPYTYRIDLTFRIIIAWHCSMA